MGFLWLSDPCLSRPTTHHQPKPIKHSDAAAGVFAAAVLLIAAAIAIFIIYLTPFSDNLSCTFLELAYHHRLFSAENLSIIWGPIAHRPHLTSPGLSSHIFLSPSLSPIWILSPVPRARVDLIPSSHRSAVTSYHRHRVVIHRPRRQSASCHRQPAAVSGSDQSPRISSSHLLRHHLTSIRAYLIYCCCCAVVGSSTTHPVVSNLFHSKLTGSIDCRQTACCRIPAVELHEFIK